MADNSSSFKGFYGMLKGIVTRTDDPQELSRIQVCIPSYHGPVDMSIDKLGSGSNEGTYPWAQVCSVNFKSNNQSSAGLLSGLWSAITGGGNEEQAAPIIMPGVGEVVWLSFEGGDIRCPIYQGSLAAAAVDASLAGGDLSNYTVGGGLVGLASEVIFAEEGGYDSINGNDNGAISVGRIQWHAGRAKDLLTQIRSTNTAQFDSLANSNGASALTSDLNMSSWNSYIVSSGSAKYNAIKAILGTSESKTVQDEQVNKDVSGYIEAGKKKGITDPGALIYWADLYNQGGAGGANVCYNAAAKPITLDSLHNGAMSTYMGKYSSRRTRVYNKIKELDKSGKLSAANGTVNIEGANLGGTYLWPVPSSTYISSYYGPRTISGISGSYHYGIDIAGNVNGKPAIAVDSGTVALITHNYDKSSGEGNCIFIQLDKNKSHYAVYMHGLYRQEDNPGLKVGDRVKAGQVVHIIGSTGASTGPHLHFGLHIGSPWGTRSTSGRINPLPYLKG